MSSEYLTPAEHAKNVVKHAVLNPPGGIGPVPIADIPNAAMKSFEELTSTYSQKILDDAVELHSRLDKTQRISFDAQLGPGYMANGKKPEGRLLEEGEVFGLDPI
ncbi:MAG TPA: hypothetical protein VG965_04810 [Patescibacteria group bacterium]|nr:hypothetical protein [Patescibacteria group bacterium]